MSTLQLCITGAVLLLVIHKLFIKPHLSPIKHLPTPDQGPLHKRFFKEPNPDQLAQWARDIPNDGFIRYHGILNIQKVLVTDPAAVQDIFITKPYSFIKPPPITKIIRSLLGDGLVVVEGEAHKTQKKAVQPAFKVRQIKDLCPVFERKTAELIGLLKEGIKVNASDEASPVDLGTYLHRVTLDLIGIAGFGLDFNCLKDPENQLATDYARGFNPSKSAQKYRLLALVMPSWLLDRLPMKRNQDLRTAVSAVRKQTGKFIEERGAMLDSKEKSSERANKDIIGVLMDDGGVRDKETLINQSMTILGAGHDTVHFAINAAIWEMCRHPEAQRRLREEVRQNLKSATAVSNEKGTDGVDIDTLPYLQAVCNEVLRLHHSVPMMHRRNIEPTVVAGQAFPKGTPFVVPIQAYNVSPKFWKHEPEHFEPERWLEDPSLGGAADRRAFLTFSAGARVCTGERFARAELKHLLAGLVGSFDMKWAGTGEDQQSQELHLEHGITSKMIGGLSVKMEPLSRW
ncbi:hypothetical protein Q7P37_008499 [Cladosporium fusiforme]